MPKENRPRSYITDRKAETVPDTAYYLRLVACADLIVASSTGNSKTSASDKIALPKKRAVTAQCVTTKGSKNGKS